MKPRWLTLWALIAIWWVEAWVPGSRLVDQHENVWQWGWSNRTSKEKKIDSNYTCETDASCYTIYITVPGEVWKGSRVRHYTPLYTLHNNIGNFSIEAPINIACCSRNASRRKQY